MILDRAVVRFAPDVLLKVVDQEALLLKLQSEEAFALNATGARIAQLIEEQLPLDRLIGTVSREYDVPREEIQRDIIDLVDALTAKGLVVSAAEASA